LKKQSVAQAAYDELADRYAALVDTKPHNAYYDRPAVQSLIPATQGQTILDAGCGTGVYTEWLLERGAAVVGIDANERMLGHARTRVGDKAEFHHANLEEPLEFLADARFDGIISPLTLTYCRDWRQPLAEFHRVLKPCGWLVFSTEHPFFSYGYNHVENYYATKKVSCTWHGFGEPVEMTSYYHSLGEIIGSLTDTGFVVDKLLEPFPAEEFREADQRGWEKLQTFPLFIFIRARTQAVALE